MIDRTAYLYYSNCSFSAVNHWIKAKVKKKKKGLRGHSSGWLAVINSTICKSSTNHMACPHQPTFNHDPPNGFSSPSPVGAKKMYPDDDHMVQPLPLLRVEHLIRSKGNDCRERRSTNGACCCQLDLYYSCSIRIWAATHVPSWRMWTWSTTALWLNSPQEWRQFLPLISDPKWFQSRAQGVSCLLVVWGQHRSFIEISSITQNTSPKMG